MGKSRTKKGSSPAKTASKFMILKRREFVAKMRLANYTGDEIVTLLNRKFVTGNDAIYNTETGKPYSRTEIYRDIKWLEKRWQESADRAVDMKMAQMLEEISRVKRAAWSDPANPKMLAQIMNAIITEARLYGFFDKKTDSTNFDTLAGNINELIVAEMEKGDEDG
jgi:hypothetical protein